MSNTIAPVIAPGTFAAADQPVIETADGLRLRPFVPGDAATIVEAFNEPDIRYYHFRRYDTEAEAKELIDMAIDGWANESFANWAIVNSRDQLIGRVGLHLFLTDGWAEIAYWVLPRARGQNVAVRAAITMTGWAHEAGLHRIELQHSVHNDRSQRVAEKAGFVREGIRRGANLHDDGWHDMVLYSHLPSDPLPDIIG